MHSKWLAALAFTVASMAAQAVPVTWSLSNLSLTDGSSVAGSFSYDAATDTVSNIDITLTTSTPGSPYTLSNLFYPTLGGLFFLFNEFVAADYTGQATLWITVATPLTDAGGIADINLANGYGWGFCSVASCTSASNPGDLRGHLESVPEPGVLSLLAAGLAAAWLSRRRKAS